MFMYIPNVSFWKNAYWLMSERFERLLVSPSLFIVLFPDKSLTNQIIVLFLQTLLQSNSLQGVYYLLKWNEYLL